MTTTIKTEELFTSLDATAYEMQQLLLSCSEEAINITPYAGSWTAAQVAAHVTKSVNAVIQALTMPGIPASRNIDEKVQQLKDTFLNFTTKLKSPDFILPTPAKYEKETLIADLREQFEQLKTLRETINLSELSNLPALGAITKLELLYFVLYHTQRHIYQLKNIFQIVVKDS